MADRQVKVTLVIDEHGAVRAMRSAADESGRTEHKFKHLDKEVKGLGKSFGGLKSIISVGLGGLGAYSVIGGLQSVVSKTKEIALETEKFHTQTGLSATSSLYYDKALKARGLSSEAVGKAFGFLSKNVRTAELQEHSFANTQLKAAAKGKISTSVLGRQASAFKELGINLTAFNKLTEQGKLEQVTKAFEALPAGMKKTRLERELFGRGGNELSIVLEKGNLGLTHQIDLVKKYFPTIKGGANAMNELVEKQTESKLAWEGLEFTLGQKLIPVMTEVMGWFSRVADEAQKGKGPLHEIENVFEGIARFAGRAVGVAKELFKIFGVKLPAGTLGAVLAAVGLRTIKHPVKGTKTAAKAVKKTGKYLAEHPYLAPFVAATGVGAAIPFGSAYGVHAGVEAVSPGYLKQHSLDEIQRSFLGGQNTGGAYGKTRAGGRAVAGGETPGEAALVAKAIESLKPTHDEHHFTMIMNGEKVAEGLLKNPRARRVLAEAVAIYSQNMTARK